MSGMLVGVSCLPWGIFGVSFGWGKCKPVLMAFLGSLESVAQLGVSRDTPALWLLSLLAIIIICCRCRFCRCLVTCHSRGQTASQTYINNKATTTSTMDTYAMAIPTLSSAANAENAKQKFCICLAHFLWPKRDDHVRAPAVVIAPGYRISSRMRQICPEQPPHTVP